MIRERKKKAKQVMDIQDRKRVLLYLAAVLLGLGILAGIFAMEMPAARPKETGLFTEKIEAAMELAQTFADASVRQSQSGEGSGIFGRSRGVFACMVNGMLSGYAVATVSRTVKDMLSSARMVMALMGMAVLLPFTDIYHLRERLRGRALDCQRHYSISSLILIFFAASGAGWLWEVVLHLAVSGQLVNRGMLHGPWLPIYGVGSVLVLTWLRRFRKWPAVEFLAAVLLCGGVEYFTSCFLEVLHGGRKWWDYSGYFINLHGRICAEGLLLFGILGMAVVYVLAPLLDDFLQKRKRGRIRLWCTLCLLLFCIDGVYSCRKPNVGAGITRPERAAVQEKAERRARHDE